MTRELISRSQAMRMGLKSYFSGKPCPRGHVDERKTINGGCRECERVSAKHKARQKRKDLAFVAADVDRCKEYRVKRIQREPEYDSRRHAKLIEKKKSAGEYEAYLEKRNEARRIARKENSEIKEKESQRYKNWAAKSRSHLTAKQGARRAMQMQRTLNSAANDNLKIQSFYDEAQRLTKQTGVLHHVDHIVPLQGETVSGLHVWWNLQVLPANENISKKNRFDPQLSFA